MFPNFSTSKFSLIDRNIIWATCHIRGGLERGMAWWRDGKMMNKKNTFSDFIRCAKFLIQKKYTSTKKTPKSNRNSFPFVLEQLRNYTSINKTFFDFELMV